MSDHPTAAAPKWGEQTALALENFGPGVPGEGTPAELIKAYAEVKKACLLALQDDGGRFSQAQLAALLRALDEVIAGRADDAFPLPLRQGGAGTSLNMNLNEVVARRANGLLAGLPGERPLDALDDVNRFQSTNDTFPTAATVMFLRRIDSLEGAVSSFQGRLNGFELAHGSVLILGRTEMRDALPMTVAQMASAWTGAAERDRWRLHKVRERFRTVPLGGTAVGTAFPATRGYVFAAERRLREVTGLNLSRSQAFADDISRLDKFAELAGAVKLLCGNLARLCADLLLLGSSMAGEILHPEAQYGSTIMAAKTNPVFLEHASGLALDAQYDCDKAARFCDSGALQLNPYLPFVCSSLLSAFDSAERALETLDGKLFPALRLDESRIAENLYSSPAVLNLLLPELGYEGVKRLYRETGGRRFSGKGEFLAFASGRTGLDAERIEALLEPANAAGARPSAGRAAGAGGRA